MGGYSLEGAVFDIYDAGGELVDTVTTDAAGMAQSKELPLGSYAITEKQAPYGFIRSPDTFSVQLTKTTKGD